MNTKIVVIDLKTTGFDAYKDEILRISAAVAENGEILDRFDAYIKPTLPIKYEVTKHTGITSDMLKDAKEACEVVSALMAFIPSSTKVLAHNGPFAQAFLRRASKDTFAHQVFDTRELATICYPFLPSHSLNNLINDLNISPELDECAVIVELWQKMTQICSKFAYPLILTINQLLKGCGKHPLSTFFKELETSLSLRRESQDVGRIEDVFQDQRLPAPREVHENPEHQSVDEDLVADIFGPSGDFAINIPAYEYREGQLQMAKSITQAFNDQKHLMVEAGTGIGKSLAYLVPSVFWAEKNNMPVVISTNTKNLQSQLIDKDLPLIQRVLKKDFTTALIKGRMNYLCLNKLFYLLRKADIELEREELLRMVNIITWATITDTGDFSENASWDRTHMHSLGSRLTSTSEECLGRACRHAKKCFLRRARAKALAADIVVANHSLVFAEMGAKSQALPPHKAIVFDEAHNIEEAATRFFSVEISEARLRFIIRRLCHSKRRDAGLVASILQQLQSGGAKGDSEIRELAVKHGNTIIECVEDTYRCTDSFFAALSGFLNNKIASQRIYPDRKIPSVWDPINDAQKIFISSLSRIVMSCESLSDALSDLDYGELSFNATFIRDLNAIVLWLKELIQDISFVTSADDENYVYWIERLSARFGGVKAWAAPLAVGEKLAAMLYPEKESIIFSSATLSVRNSFDYLKKRMGIDLIPKERLIEMDVGTPFDYANQCIVMVPMFLADLNGSEGKYEAELSVLFGEVFRRTKGRALSLFTSYSMLKKTTELLREELKGDGIQVLAQGLSGSRESITAIFRKDLESVLMGTHSFWEGVDLVGETLSCLAITRLPFAVFTDPVIEARCEKIRQEGEDAFIKYSLPSAVIRFRQGFGRLIRHKTDRGIVIVTDKRIISKRYGRWFRDSIPVNTLSFIDREQFLSAIEEFLASE